MATLIVSFFGLFVMGVLAGLCTAPSEQPFTVLAYGWAVASGERQTITVYRWLSGARSVKHCAGFYVFWGGALYDLRWPRWGRSIRGAARWGPAGDPIVLEVDDSTRKKAGRHVEGVGHYRNGAGWARQEYRTLRGLNFVWGIRRVPVPGWPGQTVSVPIGVSLSRKEEQAQKLKLPDQSRSALARAIGDFVAAQLPQRQIRVLGDGGSATTESLQECPATVNVVGRRLITGKLYAPPPPREPSRRGGPPKKGPLLGSPKTLARQRVGWQPPPTEAGALVHAWDGLWPTVLPGRLLRVVVVRRPAAPCRRQPGQRKPPAPVEACFTTDLTLRLEALLAHYRERWGRSKSPCGIATPSPALARTNAASTRGWWALIPSASSWPLPAPCGLWHRLAGQKRSPSPAIALGTVRKSRPLNSISSGRGVKPCRPPEFFLYHGSPQLLPQFPKCPKLHSL